MAHTGEGVGGNHRAGPFVCMVPGLPARSISWQVQMGKADPESLSHFSYRSSLNFQPGVKDGDSCSRKKGAVATDRTGETIGHGDAPMALSSPPSASLSSLYSARKRRRREDTTLCGIFLVGGDGGRGVASAGN